MQRYSARASCCARTLVLWGQCSMLGVSAALLAGACPTAATAAALWPPPLKPRTGAQDLLHVSGTGVVVATQHSLQEADTRGEPSQHAAAAISPHRPLQANPPAALPRSHASCRVSNFNGNLGLAGKEGDHTACTRENTAQPSPQTRTRFPAYQFFAGRTSWRWFITCCLL